MGMVQAINHVMKKVLVIVIFLTIVRLRWGCIFKNFFIRDFDYCNSYGPSDGLYA